MNKLILSIFLFSIVAGCNFDEQRQADLQYPATMEINNNLTQNINVKSIYSTPEAKGGFTLEGGSIAPQSTLTLKISESAYDAIRAGNFILEGACGDVTNWKVAGATLSQNAVEDQSEWKVSISITGCGS